jgi:hypothetical protein
VKVSNFASDTADLPGVLLDIPQAVLSNALEAPQIKPRLVFWQIAFSYLLLSYSSKKSRVISRILDII